MVFARPPLAGRAKTRLIPALGPFGAARVHARLAAGTLSVAAAVADELPGVTLRLCTAAPAAHPFFAAAGRRWPLQRSIQRGADLGQRMHHALRDSLARAECAVLIGTDCARLSSTDLVCAFARLDDDCDAVLGPALDGGYWLIGLRHPAPALFHGIDWGSDRVAAQTRQRLRRLGLRWRELPPRADLDRPADLLGSGIQVWRGA